MTTKLETSSMDLKSEKALVFEIKKVTAQKEQLKEWEEIKAKIESRKEAHEELYKKRQEVGEKLTDSRDAEKVITAKLDAWKSGLAQILATVSAAKQAQVDQAARAP